MALFCSANDVAVRQFGDVAEAFGAAVATAGYTLVYGGGARGLMGIAAKAAHAAGGLVHGVMSQALRDREGALEAIGTLEIAGTLMDRKARMIALANAFVALPGGIGTLDEFTDVVTLNDIGTIAKPIIICNAKGFWTPLVGLMQHLDGHGMLRAGTRRAVIVADGVATTIER
ncbi:MAG TPA: TIGR00730 family Rossman fold protein, partial [Hyphomicrobiaceae bacterium]|nr:TIGR00730 family Rossman fold protein [Hyphomicrobiaceae bacterium]